ncbi:Glucan endo-1,3-beta-glucosidase GIV [Triticum urartu]|uniref:Glucan endo-1,3-beta-glucosidase GIV n=1 Tax=Triticum urartu TaxID=4572 RepID=M8A4Q4_TRIUA|nr:Glucan endo-1,3-beta-glucosidase GIV [Triticum urartu]
MPGMRGSAPVLALALLVGVFIAQAPAGVQSIGVCYGIIGNNLPPPSDVVQFYRFLGITNMRVYSVQLQALDALRGSGISLSLGTTHNDLNYATFQPGATPVRDAGNGLIYTNLFDAMVDALYAALERAGAPGVRVVVSETGWPSAGGFAATPENARAYNQGLIDHVARGTPKRPGPIEAYVFAMFNENMKPGDETERNFGLFYPNKLPVYPMRFA